MIIVAVLGMAGCGGLKETPETDAAFDAYEAAIRQSIAHKKGHISVLTENVDTVIEKKSTVGVIEYEFSTDAENRVSFTREDYTDGVPVASYKGDGKKAYQLDKATGEWKDVTEESAEFLVHDTNYMNTLSLFRIDSNFNYSTYFLEELVMEEKDGEKVIKFTLANDAVTDMMEFSDSREISREMASQTRTYYVNKEGDISKIIIDTLQNIRYEGKEGTLSSKLTITPKYE